MKLLFVITTDFNTNIILLAALFELIFVVNTVLYQITLSLLSHEL